MISQKIKIIHIITKLELGGAQKTTLYTLSQLDKRRFIPVLVCGPGGMLLPEAMKIPGLIIHICPWLIRPISPLDDLRAVIGLFDILAKEKISHNGPIIVHTHSSKAGILGRCAACLARIPVRIHTVHGFGFNLHQPIVLKWALIFSEIITGFFTTKFIFVSIDNLKEGLRLGISTQKKSCIIRSGVEWNKFSNIKTDKAALKEELGISSDAKVVGMVSCFRHQKAPLDFIHMAYLVNLELPQTHFLLIGDGELREKIEINISRLQLNRNIHLTGWRMDIPNLMDIFDIMVLTSLWEGLPKVVVEAQLMGVPVIATKTSGVEEVIRDGLSGFITPPGRPDIMAEKAIELLKNPKALIKMGKEARSVSKEFDIKETVLSQEMLYGELLGNKSS